MILLFLKFFLLFIIIIFCCWWYLFINKITLLPGLNFNLGLFIGEGLVLVCHLNVKCICFVYTLYWHISTSHTVEPTTIWRGCIGCSIAYSDYVCVWCWMCKRDTACLKTACKQWQHTVCVCGYIQAVLVTQRSGVIKHHDRNINSGGVVRSKTSVSNELSGDWLQGNIKQITRQRPSRQYIIIILHKLILWSKRKWHIIQICNYYVCDLNIASID